MIFEEEFRSFESFRNLIDNNGNIRKPIQREYLVAIMGCPTAVHLKEWGSRGLKLSPGLLSGYPSDRPLVKFDSNLIKVGFTIFYPEIAVAAGLWGISFAGNITPDETGIGNGTEVQFKKALTEGKFKGLDEGRPLLPPMPWQNYRTLKDHEIHAKFMLSTVVLNVSLHVLKPGCQWLHL